MNPANGIELWDQSDRQKETKVDDKISEKVGFELGVKQWKSDKSMESGSSV